ncbi:NYN domain [Actinobacteria bacterium IMCC26256]|nr:NYN domain [Actinobacteria bacterium IMCC26256]
MTNKKTTHQPQRLSDAVNHSIFTAMPNENELPRTRVRSAIFLDFDNVFGGLWSVDSAAALRFAGSPQEWLERLAVFHNGKNRDFLIRKIYLNPNGSIARASDEGGRILFQRFRTAFTNAGFEVVDCPALTSAQKNAADIRIVLDVIDVMASTNLDEIIIASSDADFTPLMYRLRASDQCTLILSTSRASAAYRNTADSVIDNGMMLQLITGSPTAKGGDKGHLESAPDASTRVSAEVGPGDSASREEPVTQDLPVSSSAAGLARVSEWRSRFPAEITALCEIADLPEIATECWPPLLAEIASVSADLGTYSPGDASRLVRDRLGERGVIIGRRVIGLVYCSLAKAGVDTEAKEGHNVDGYIHALVALHSQRAAAVGWILNDEEIQILSTWLAGDEKPPVERIDQRETGTPLAAMSEVADAEAA